jgi:hypothetical protein
VDFIAHVSFSFLCCGGFSGLKLKVHKFGVGLFLIFLSSTLVFLPSSMAFPYYTFFPSYVPTSMLQNTVSSSDCQDTVNVLQWTSTNMDTESRLLVHEAFFGWALLTIDYDRLIFYGYNDPAIYAQQLGANVSQLRLYLIWWVNGSGWYGQPTVSSTFREVYESGRMAIYLYQPSINYTASNLDTEH